MHNRLQYETSPYLLQHAENPVDWYPWCEEAFQRAKAEDKPEPVRPKGNVAEPTVLDIADDPKPEVPEDDPFADIFKIF